MEGTGRGRKQNPKPTAFKQLLFTVCTEPGGQSIPVQPPLGAGCDTDARTQPRPTAGGGSRGSRCCGAEVALARGAAAVGAEDQKAPVLGQRDRRPQCPVPPAPAWGTKGRTGPGAAAGASGRARVLVPGRALPAAWESPLKSKRWMRRASQPSPQVGCTAPGFGARGAEERLGVCRVTAHKPAQKPRAGAWGRSGPRKALGRDRGGGAGGAEAALPGPRAAPGSPSPPPRPQPTRRRLQPTHGCRGVWEQPWSWERLRPTCRPSPRPLAATGQGDTPSSHQPPRHVCDSRRDAAPARPQSHGARPQRQAAARRAAAGSQIQRETSVLPFPLHMHQAGESPPSRALVPSRINISAGTSSPTHQGEGVEGGQCVSDGGDGTESASDHGRNVKRNN